MMQSTSLPSYIHGSSATERQRLALMNRLINQRCLEALKLSDENLVLDVGAGTGQFTRLMAAQLPGTARVIAVERDPEQLAAARRLGTALPTGCTIDYRQGDAFDLPLKPDEVGQVDLAHTRFLLEHVADPLGVVKNMAAAVRSRGRVVLLDDDHELMQFWPEPEGLIQAWEAYYRSYVLTGNDPLIGRKLVSLLCQAGLQPMRIRHVFYGACAGEPEFSDVVENLVGVLEGATDKVIEHGEISASAYSIAVENFREFARLPDATVWYDINFAEGLKA